MMLSTWVFNLKPLFQRIERPTHALDRLFSLHCCAAIAERTLLAGSSTQTRCVEYYNLISRDIIGEEASTTSFKCMVRYVRTGPALATQHGLDFGWSATCDGEFTIVVHINIVMSCGNSHMHEMRHSKQTWWCLSTPWVFHLKQLFLRVLADLQHT